MASVTDNYKFTKPADAAVYDISGYNATLDDIDAAIAAAATAADAAAAALTTYQAAMSDVVAFLRELIGVSGISALPVDGDEGIETYGVYVSGAELDGRYLFENTLGHNVDTIIPRNSGDPGYMWMTYAASDSLNTAGINDTIEPGVTAVVTLSSDVVSKGEDGFTWYKAYYSEVNDANISELGGLSTSVKSSIVAAINSLVSEKANIASPVLTGTPRAVTTSASDSSTRIATTAFVHSLLDGFDKALKSNTYLSGLKADGLGVDLFVEDTARATGYAEINYNYETSPHQIGTWIDESAIYRVAGSKEIAASDITATGEDVQVSGINLQDNAAVLLRQSYCFDNMLYTDWESFYDAISKLGGTQTVYYVVEYVAKE